MIFQKVQIIYSLLLCLVFESVAQLSDHPFGFQIHPLFEVVKSKYEGYLIGLNTSLSFGPSKGYHAINLFPAMSNRLSENGTFSFYGQDVIRSGRNTYDYGLHKLFYKMDHGKVTFSTGVGYDFDGVNEMYIDETINTTQSWIFESQKTLSIKKWTENSIFANINGTYRFSSQKWLISGVEMVHSIKNGIEYVEQNESTLNSLREYNDIIHYFNYDKGAYRNRVTIGAGLLKEFFSKRQNEWSFLSYMMYERISERSNLSVLEGVRSSFIDEAPDNVQFSGKDNHSNSIALTCILTEKDPDKLYFNRKWNAPFQAHLKSVNLEVKLSGNTDKTLSANQWNFNETSYGLTERVSTHCPLTAHGGFYYDIMIFSFFNLRLNSDLNSTIEFYSKNEISNWSYGILTPYIGFTIPVRNRVLIDFYYSPVFTSVDFYSNNNSLSFSWDADLHTVFQLRLSLLKEYRN